MCSWRFYFLHRIVMEVELCSPPPQACLLLLEKHKLSLFLANSSLVLPVSKANVEIFGKVQA